MHLLQYNLIDQTGIHHTTYKPALQFCKHHTGSSILLCIVIYLEGNKMFTFMTNHCIYCVYPLVSASNRYHKVS